MMLPILRLEIRFEQDVVMTRQRTRQIAELLGFDAQDQTRIATAVSEISRNAFQYAGGGKVEFYLEGESSQCFLIKVQDQGKGIANLQRILDGQYTSKTGMGLGIVGTQRLMERFHIQSTPGRGTTVQMGKNLPRRSPFVSKERLGQIVDELVQRSPQNPFAEIQQQNQELLRALGELRQREEQLTHLNRELEDTNRGVVLLYAELDEKAASLQKANELKTRFLSNMSHEFRTPLNSIISLSGLLLDHMDGELTLEQEKQVTFIRKAAEGLSELVNDLLDLAKVEAGKVMVYPRAFEVSELFSTLRGMLRPLLAHDSSITLSFEEPTAGIPTLYTDEDKVAQILRNFIANALKYTEQGKVQVSATLTDNLITFSVADTGIGIAFENQERIFEEYIQIASPLQNRSKGTGLGLPLSRKLAELLGGSVSVKSELGVGSTFFAAIPITYPGFTPESPVTPAWKLDPTRSPVLVIEDNAETLFTYEKYFQRSRYQMLSARTLNQAKQAMQAFQPCAVVLDILLAEQHSWTFLAELKENAATQKIPILVLTVIDNEQKATVGADVFLIKPVDRLLLLNTLNRLTRQNRLQTLLLIDDDPVAHYLFKELLHDTGCNFLEATDGQEGIRLAQTEQPNCIVLDLAMPISGFEVLDQLQSDSRTASIPVIIQTSQVLQEAQALANRVVAVLSKERLSRVGAITQLREALIQAGLALEIGKDHA